MHGDPGGGEFGFEVAYRFLARADDHIVDPDHPGPRSLRPEADMHAVVVDPLVVDAADLLYPFGFQRRSMHPARRLTQPFAERCVLALQQNDLTCRRPRPGGT